jgi:hypothetical protein
MPKIITKKTIAVKTIVDQLNDTLSTGFQTIQERQAIMTFVEQILRDTGNYRGFQYLTQEQVPLNQLPGIRGKNGDEVGSRFMNTDSTRVKYC